MPGLVRVHADAHQGHAGISVPYHKTYYSSGSQNVFVNNESLVRKNDKCLCGDQAVGGSSNVYANNILVHRLGDSTSGHGNWVPTTSASGSQNVFANS